MMKFGPLISVGGAESLHGHKHHMLHRVQYHTESITSLQALVHVLIQIHVMTGINPFLTSPASYSYT